MLLMLVTVQQRIITAWVFIIGSDMNKNNVHDIYTLYKHTEQMFYC